MSHKASIFYVELPGGGEVHLYQTFDPEICGVHDTQDEIILSIWAPDFGDIQLRIDRDSPLSEDLKNHLPFEKLRKKL